MKNIWLIILFSSIFTVTIGQSSSFSIAENAPCSFENPYNIFENGLQSSSEHTQVVANDFVVNAGNVFILEEMIFNFFTSDNITFVDVRYYMDEGGIPGTQIGNEEDIVPTSCIDIGDFGLIVHRVTLDVQDFDFTAQSDADTTFWVSIVCTNAAGDDLCFWEITTATQEGNPSAVNDNNMGWESYDPGNGSVWDGVYEFMGECTLSTNDYRLSTLVAYPNPTSDKINLVIPNSLGITSIGLYDITGKQMDLTIANNVLDVSNLPNGLYILKVATDDGVASHKVVKR